MTVLAKCPKCGGHKAVPQYADAFGGKVVFIVHRCKDCGHSFRKAEPYRHVL